MLCVFKHVKIKQKCHLIHSLSSPLADSLAAIIGGAVAAVVFVVLVVVVLLLLVCCMCRRTSTKYDVNGDAGAEMGDMTHAKPVLGGKVHSTYALPLLYLLPISAHIRK